MSNYPDDIRDYDSHPGSPFYEEPWCEGGCGNPESYCECEEDCEECGNPESECDCDGEA